MKVVLWFLMMFMPLMANASSVNEEQLFHRLDSYIAQRSKFTQRKEAKLLRLKKQLHMASDKRSQLSLYNQIYREYYTYRYDSAMTYAKKGYQLAVQLQDDYFINLNKDDGSIKQYNFNHAQANQYLKDTLLSKMKEAGLEEDETLDICFDLSYSKKKLKLVRYHGIGNKASLCPVVIKGKPETKQFIWNVGVGNCTGIGFGAIY